MIGRDTVNMPEIFQVLRFRRFHCNDKSGFHVRACTDHPRRPKGSQLGRDQTQPTFEMTSDYSQMSRQFTDDESFPEDGTDKSAFLIPTLFIY